MKQTGCFTAEHVKTHIMNKYRVAIRLHQIRHHFKHIHNLSYKKGNPRPALLDTERIKLLIRLFCAKLAQRLTEVRILVNIDESTISKDTCRKYSWLEKGKAWSITNIAFTKSINVISAVTTDGAWINMFKYTTTTKETVIAFIKYILKYLRLKMHLNPWEIGIVLDNWASHRTKLVKEYWAEIGVKMFYLPQYSPELAPIELYFSKLKSDPIRIVGRESLDLGSESALTKVSKCVEQANQDYWKGVWNIILQKVVDELAE